MVALLFIKYRTIYDSASKLSRIVSFRVILGSAKVFGNGTTGNILL
jgi:hypothetical protein